MLKSLIISEILKAIPSSSFSFETIKAKSKQSESFVLPLQKNFQVNKKIQNADDVQNQLKYTLEALWLSLLGNDVSNKAVCGVHMWYEDGKLNRYL